MKHPRIRIRKSVPYTDESFEPAPEKPLVSTKLYSSSTGGIYNVHSLRRVRCLCSVYLYVAFLIYRVYQAQCSGYDIKVTYMLQPFFSGG